MSEASSWWELMQPNQAGLHADGLVTVADYEEAGRPPEEALMVERARQYHARAVFFGLEQPGKAPVAQAFVYDGSIADDEFALLHKKLWSWGGVPLLYRFSGGVLQLFRCGHKADFVGANGRIVCRPVETLRSAAEVAQRLAHEPWWDPRKLRNGTLWEDASACKALLSAKKSAHKLLISAVKDLNTGLSDEGVLPKPLRRRLLILCLLIAYLENRGAFAKGYFSRFSPGATHFFEVLRNGQALVELLGDLEERFNGHVFTLKPADRERLLNGSQLDRFANLVEGRKERNGQLTLWQLYSFGDLPVELISHIYQLFVKDANSSVYTPPFLVRLVVDEALSWSVLDRLHERGEVILDCSCGSGIFLVEAYKRLILHWRVRNGWRKPGADDLKSLLLKVHGVDLEEAAVELAAFSLCLALCDALEPEEIRKTVRLFPELKGSTLHHSCFFEAKEQGMLTAPIGAVLGNPPFVAKLTTKGAERAYARYVEAHGRLPDFQLAFLFLHEAMELLASDGVLAMLQSYNLLYNSGSLEFRRRFLSRWDVREILDFISVRGLFDKAGVDTKVIVVVARAGAAATDQILHATFRRTGLAEAERGFSIDHYDLHWVPRALALTADHVWRCNLLGGGRLLHLVSRLREYPTLEDYANEHEWEYGEGFIEAKPGARGTDKSKDKLIAAPHLTGKPLLTTSVLMERGVDISSLETVTTKLFKSPYTAERYTAPMTLVHQQFDLSHGFLAKGYVTYKNQIVGFCGPKSDEALIEGVSQYLSANKQALKAFVAATSIKLFTQHATTLSAADVRKLPYPPRGDLALSRNERLVIADVTEFYRDLVRFADTSRAYEPVSADRLGNFAKLFCGQVSGVYKDTPLGHVDTQQWQGVVCQCFSFGDGEVDWGGSEQLSDRVAHLLRERQSQALEITRVCVLYDSSFIFLLKPDRTRYWLDSVALRDADLVVAELREQGF